MSWYDNLDEKTGKGSRISFVDMTDPRRPKYRHVLLVEPYLLDQGAGVADRPTFRAVHSHAGGIMWYGKLLYVADTWNGIRVFDTTKIFEVSTGDSAAIGWQPNDIYSAHNYLYALPQVAAYDNDRPRVNGVPVYETMRFSCVSLDRSTTPDSVVVAEYGEPAEPATRKRLFRFDLDATTRRLATGSDGKATATRAYQVDINGVNGATSTEGKYYFARVDADLSGDLITWVPGSYVKYYDATSKPQDVSYDKHTRWLWNMSETPGKRLVYARSIDQLA